MRASVLAARIGARLVGEDREIRSAAGLEEAGDTDVSFFSNRKYRRALDATRAGAVIVDEGTAEGLDGALDAARLVYPNPYAGYAKALEALHPPRREEAGVDPRAVIEAGAEVDPSATIMAFAYVCAGARIGPRTVLHPHTYVGRDTSLGADCELQAGATVRERCTLGDRVVLQPRVVVGGDGFGYALDRDDEGRPLHRKVPQVGTVVVEDDVEIGAGACIDRATTGETRIGRGSKIDNLVQVGHNVTIGPLSIVCGQVGIAGSTEVGQGVVLAGQVGLAGHLRVGDGVTVGAQAGVIGNVPDGEIWSGYPAMPHKVWLKGMAALKELPELIRRVRRLERDARS